MLAPTAFPHGWQLQELECPAVLGSDTRYADLCSHLLGVLCRAGQTFCLAFLCGEPDLWPDARGLRPSNQSVVSSAKTLRGDYAARRTNPLWGGTDNPFKKKSQLGKTRKLSILFRTWNYVYCKRGSSYKCHSSLQSNYEARQPEARFQFTVFLNSCW